MGVPLHIARRIDGRSIQFHTLVTMIRLVMYTSAVTTDMKGMFEERAETLRLAAVRSLFHMTTLSQAIP